jgi:hypothetical protein
MRDETIAHGIASCRHRIGRYFRHLCGSSAASRDAFVALARVELAFTLIAFVLAVVNRIASLPVVIVTLPILMGGVALGDAKRPMVRQLMALRLMVAEESAGGGAADNDNPLVESECQGRRALAFVAFLLTIVNATEAIVAVQCVLPILVGIVILADLCPRATMYEEMLTLRQQIATRVESRASVAGVARYET